MARFRRCIMCEKLFRIDDKSGTVRYCSNACKQKAYRIAKSVNQKIKRRTYIYAGKCMYCGLEFATTSARAAYCSNACRQVAYRERKAGR